MRALFHLLLLVTLLSSKAAAAELEHEVKAAILFKFLPYVAWPEQAFSGDEAPIVIGVLDADEVRVALEEIVQGRAAQGRPVEVRDVKGVASPAGVHVLFVGRDSAEELPELARQHGVLVVSEAEGALDRGAMVNLLRIDDRVRFQVAPASAERNGLYISSRVLAVAQYVKPAVP